MASMQTTIKLELSPKSQEIIKDLRYLVQALERLEKDLPWRIADIQKMRARILRIMKNMTNAKTSKTSGT